jgi:hypothetical protein
LTARKRPLDRRSGEGQRCTINRRKKIVANIAAHHLTDEVPTGFSSRGRTTRELEQWSHLEDWEVGQSEVRAAIEDLVDRDEVRYVDGGRWPAVHTSCAA